ncbi:MAG: hypothetical protein K2N72_00670 [Oscillospiraceae bacterium]|nr:hypothetical protein [Oscillospiraceae bacterium]
MQLIKDNDLTGFKFEEVYDSETFKSDKEADNLSAKAKVYRIKSCEGYRQPAYSENNSRSKRDTHRYLLNPDGSFHGVITWEFDFCTEEHRKRNEILGDFMLTDLEDLWLVNERAKKIIGEKYGGLITFYPLKSTDENGGRYYSFLPSEYIDCLDGEGLRFSRSDFESDYFDGLYDLDAVSRFCFKNFVQNHPIFRIKQLCVKKGETRYPRADSLDHHETDCIFVLEEFVRFVKENNLTGFEFEEVYDSETFDPDREAEGEIKAPGKIRVYKMEYCEGYRWPIYSEDNPMTLQEANDLLWNEETGFDGSIPFKFDFCQMALSDVMHTNITGFLVVNECAKNIIESKYGGFIHFFPLDGTDERGNKYYSFLPSEYIEAGDALDAYKSEFYPCPVPRSPDGEYNLALSTMTVNKYCFKELVKNYPVFRLKQSGFNKETGKAETLCNPVQIFVLEEFVRFIDEHNITGFNFIKVYDSETFDTVTETDNKTAAAASGPQTRITIPMTHENGVFTPEELAKSLSTGMHITVEYDGCMITNLSNSYTVYDIDNCDMSKDLRVTYRRGRLQSVYVFSGKVRLPVYISFDISSPDVKAEYIKKKLRKTVTECAGLCGEDMMRELEEAPTPLEPLSLEYYYDDEQMDINLQDRSGNIYSIGNAASHLLRCICSCAGELENDGRDFGYSVFESILEGVRIKLSEDIPKRFKVSDDFEVSEPLMYD